MSSPVTSPTGERSSQTSPKKPESKEGTSKFAQEKIMLALVLVFFLGVVALTLVPPQFSGAAMGLILFLTMVALFRFN